jgi:hypothetical protein
MDLSRSSFKSPLLKDMHVTETSLLQKTLVFEGRNIFVLHIWVIGQNFQCPGHPSQAKQLLLCPSPSQMLHNFHGSYASMDTPTARLARKKQGHLMSTSTICIYPRRQGRDHLCNACHVWHVHGHACHAMKCHGYAMLIYFHATCCECHVMHDV